MLSIHNTLVPIVRTSAPFVAGMGRMSPTRFAGSALVGAECWVAVCASAGCFRGSLSFVKRIFSVVIVGIVGISVLPMMVGSIRVCTRNQKPGGPRPEAAARVTEL